MPPNPIEQSPADRRRAELLSSLSRPAAVQTPRPKLPSAFLSTSRLIPDTLIVESVATSLKKQTGENVLVVKLALAENRAEAGSWSPLHSLPNRGFAFADRLQPIAVGVDRILLGIATDQLDNHFISAAVGHCARNYPHVIIQLAAELPAAALAECASRAAAVYVLTHQTVEGLFQFSAIDRGMREAQGGIPSALKPVVCLQAKERPQTTDDFLKQIGQPAHFYLRGCPASPDRIDTSLGRDGPGSLQFDLRRLAREIGHCRMGLALSSGGAKGLAHVGVIQVLEENGIEVDVIAGTSMGAYVGSLWAFGHNGRFLEEKAMELKGRCTLCKLIDPALPPRRGFIYGKTVKQRLMKSIGTVRFAELARPLRVVATHLATLDRVVFSTGEVATAVHASSAIPGVVVPVDIGTESFIDGGITSPLPVSVLREMGVERIIAVNTIPTPAVLRCALEMEREQEGRQRRPFRLLSYLNRHLNYFARGNILDTMERAITGAQIRNAEEACRQAQVVIRPLSYDASWHDFSHPEKYVALGRRVAEEHLDEIRALVRHQDTAHEIGSAHPSLAATR